MKKTLPRNWPYVFVFTLICATAFGMIVFRPEVFMPSTPPELTPSRDALPAKVKILLTLNDEKTIGKSKIIYRGLSGDSEFKMDVVIMDLDPNASYGYRLSIDKAQKGFRLAGHKFKLITARKNAIQIWHLGK